MKYSNSFNEDVILSFTDDAITIASLFSPQTVTLGIGIKYLTKFIVHKVKAKDLDYDIEKRMAVAIEAATKKSIDGCNLKDKQLIEEAFIRFEKELEQNSYYKCVSLAEYKGMFQEHIEKLLKLDSLQDKSLIHFVYRFKYNLISEFSNDSSLHKYISIFYLDDISKDIKKISKDVEKIQKNTSDANIKRITLNNPPHGIMDIIGRDYDKIDIKESLEDESLIYIYGIGGLGKTEFVKSVVKDLKEHYNIGWFDYLDNLKNTLIQIGKPDQSIADEYYSIISYLKKLDKKTILVFDNVHDLTDEELDFILSLKCKVIITSRETLKGIDNIAKYYALDFLSNEDCVKMFEFYCDESFVENEYEINQIVGLTGRHTLALELLAKIYKEEYESLNDLLNQLQVNGFKLDNIVTRNAMTSEIEFYNHMCKLFDISRINEPTQIHVLKNYCLFDSTPIKTSKLLSLIGEKYRNDLIKLSSIGWIKKEKTQYSIHKAISLTLREKLNPTYKDCENLIKNINSKINFGAYDVGRYDIKNTNHIPSIARYFFEKDYMEEAIAEFLHNIAEMCLIHGYYDISLKYFKKALVIWEDILGIEHAETLLTYSCIATIYFHKGRLDEALLANFRVLKICIDISGSNSALIASSYNRIAAIYLKKRNEPLALYYYNKSLELNIDYLGEFHIDTASIYNNLGNVYHEKRQYRKALFYYEKAKYIYENTIGEEHLCTGTVYGNIGEIFVDIGEYIVAKKFFDKALDIHTRLLGTYHPETAKLLSNIAYIFEFYNQYEMALELYFIAYSTYLYKVGQSHSDTLDFFKDLYKCYIASGKNEDKLKNWLNDKLEEHEPYL